MRTRWIVVTVVVAVATSACSGAGSGSIPTAPGSATSATSLEVGVATEDASAWVATDNTTAMLIRWTQSPDGRLEGTLQIARLAGESINSDTVPVTGLRNGGSLSLTIDQLFGVTTTITGEIGDSSLTTYWPSDSGELQPVVFRAGTVDDYNAWVASLSDVAVGNQQAAVADEAIIVADGKLATARRNMEVAFDAVESARVWVGYSVDSINNMIGILNVDVERLEGMIASEPEYAWLDLEAVESTYDGFVAELEYVRSADNLGVVDSALTDLVQAMMGLETAMQGVRNAEAQYLSEEFGPYEFAAEDTLLDEASVVVNSTGPDSITEYQAIFDQAETKARQLVEYARSIVS